MTSRTCRHRRARGRALARGDGASISGLPAVEVITVRPAHAAVMTVIGHPIPGGALGSPIDGGARPRSPRAHAGRHRGGARSPFGIRDRRDVASGFGGAGGHATVFRRELRARRRSDRTEREHEDGHRDDGTSRAPRPRWSSRRLHASGLRASPYDTSTLDGEPAGRSCRCQDEPTVCSRSVRTPMRGPFEAAIPGGPSRPDL